MKKTVLYVHLLGDLKRGLIIINLATGLPYYTETLTQSTLSLVLFIYIFGSWVESEVVVFSVFLCLRIMGCFKLSKGYSL